MLKNSLPFKIYSIISLTRYFAEYSTLRSTTCIMGKSVFSPEILSLFTKKIQGGKCQGMSSAQVQRKQPEFFEKFDANTFRSRFSSLDKSVGLINRTRIDDKCFTF